MGITLIKKLNEKTPYWVKAPFSGAIRKKLIDNKVFIKTYDQLLAFDKLSDSEKAKRQLELLGSTLAHAYEHSLYYKDLFERCGISPENIESIDDLQRLPVLTKDTLKNQLENIVADDIEDSYVVTTGGTTGEPTKIYMDKDAIYREWAFIYHYWAQYGYDYKTSKIATFRGVEMGNKISEINPLYAEIRLNPFIMNDHNIKEYCKKIDSYGADFIYGYPSAIYNFCRLSKKAGIDQKNRFKAALMISENLYEFQESMIKDVIGCPCVIFYGHSERAVFAERDDRGYAFHPLYGIIEISDEGEPIVTGFINPKTPLIRYLVDDYVELNDTGSYSIMGHHESEVLYGKNGEQISMAAINFHDDTFVGIVAYQFVQNEVGKCIIRIASDEEIKNEKVQMIRQRVSKKLENTIIFNVEVVDRIPLTSRGKYRMLIQNCKPGK